MFTKGSRQLLRKPTNIGESCYNVIGGAGTGFLGFSTDFYMLPLDFNVSIAFK
jgi:hypothetical protein